MFKMIGVAAALLGVVCVVMACIYWLTPASGLPSFVPGYSANLDRIHVTHGIVALIVGLGLFGVAWFAKAQKT